MSERKRPGGDGDSTLDLVCEIHDRLKASSAWSRSYDKSPWKIAHDLHDGWLVAACGAGGEDGKDYYVVTSGVHASELSGDAAADATLIANAPHDLMRLCKAYLELVNENMRLRTELEKK